MSSPMELEVCKSDMIRCAIEWQPRASEAAFNVWPPKTERASQGKRPHHDSVPGPAVPDRMMLSYCRTSTP